MPSKHRFVTDKELQRVFNQAKYPERIQTGEFIEIVVEERPAHPKYNQPKGTVSQSVELRDYNTGAFRGKGHRFVTPTGEVGGSGQLDPKVLRHQGVTYIIDPEASKLRKLLGL